jgi:hypothetical protein
MKSQDTPEKVLTGQQCKAIALLAGGASIEFAAIEVKVNASTIHAWLKKESFIVEYKAATSLVIEHATSQLKSATGEAVSVLRSVANDGEAPASSRVSAARTILEMAYRAREMDDVIARIEALENQTP